MGKFRYKDHLLNEEAVDLISAEVQDHLTGLDIEPRSIQRIRLTAEEVLIRIMELCGKETTVSIGFGKQFGRQMLRICYEGPAIDPVKDSDVQPHDLMQTLGLRPSWSRRGSMNTVSLVLADRPRLSGLFYIFLAIALAVLLGLAGRSFPQAFTQGLDEILLTPLSSAFLGLLRTFAGLLILFSICSGMIGLGNSAALGRLGKSVISRFIGISFLLSAVTVAAVIPALRLNYAKTAFGDASQISMISEMIFNILPSNIVEPFLTGNSMQIIAIALFIGIALLAIGENGRHIRDLISEAAVLFQRIISAVTMLVPLYVFVMLVRLFWFGDAKVLLSIWQPVVTCLLSVVTMAAIYWLWSAARLKCPPLGLLKKVIRPFIIAISTSSNLAAFSTSVEICEKELGVKESVVSFAYPLGATVFMPGGIIAITALCCSLAKIFNMEVSLFWVIMAVISVSLLVIAMPPVPGAALLMYNILFASLGLPGEALVITAALDVVMLDSMDTGFSNMLLLFEIACAADSSGDLDREILMRGMDQTVLTK